MGYFSNSTEGEMYQDKWCCRCLHQNARKAIACPVWRAHLLMNYAECNNPESILHMLIPRSKDDLNNERCTMFVDRGLLSNLAMEQFEGDYE